MLFFSMRYSPESFRMTTTHSLPPSSLVLVLELPEKTSVAMAKKLITYQSFIQVLVAYGTVRYGTVLDSDSKAREKDGARPRPARATTRGRRTFSKLARLLETPARTPTEEDRIQDWSMGTFKAHYLSPLTFEPHVAEAEAPLKTQKPAIDRALLSSPLQILKR
jgi:hypothetical protein